jgi:hypothetical protein
MKAPLAGGAPIMLAADSYFVHDLAISATSLYWTDPYALYKVSVDGGTPAAVTTRAPATGGVGMIAVDQTNLYWIDNDGNIEMMPLAGGSPPTVLVSNLFNATGIAVDATNVYWTNYDGTIKTIVRR